VFLSLPKTYILKNSNSNLSEVGYLIPLRYSITITLRTNDCKKHMEDDPTQTRNHQKFPKPDKTTKLKKTSILKTVLDINKR